MLAGIVKSVDSCPGVADLIGHSNMVGSKHMNKYGYPAPHYRDFLNTLTEYIAIPLGTYTERNA